MELTDEVCKAIAENKRLIAAAVAEKDVNVKSALYGEAFAHARLIREYLQTMLKAAGHKVVAILDYTDVLMEKSNLRHMFNILPPGFQADIVKKMDFMPIDTLSKLSVDAFFEKVLTQGTASQIEFEKEISQAHDRLLCYNFVMLPIHKKVEIGKTLGFMYVGGDPQYWEQALLSYVKGGNKLDELRRVMASIG